MNDPKQDKILIVDSDAKSDTLQRRQPEQAGLAVAVESATDAILLADVNQRITLANAAAAELLQCPIAELLGQPLDRFMTGHVGVTNHDKHSALVQLRSCERGRRADGSEFPLEASVARFVVNEQTFYTIFVRDISEKKNLEAQYLRAQRMESIGVLAGGIAHDLNNVLTPILMALELLKMRATDSESQAMLAILTESAFRGADLVKQVLAFARGTHGQRQPLLVPPLLGELRKLLQQTFPKDIVIEVNFPRDLWLVSAEPTQVHQVFLNLCVNSRDAMPRGGQLTLSAENRLLTAADAEHNLDARPGPYLVLTVTDTGSGIPAENLDKIFDPFFTTKEVGKGTGLGLSTALGIVKGHGGFVTVASEVGQGTRFSIFLPALESGAIRREETGLRPPSGHDELILVVDDESSILHLCQAILEANGYRVLTATGGQLAIDLVKEHGQNIHAVITDIAMPEMDGVALVRAVRKVHPKAKIIASSGFAPEARKTLQVEGITKYLAKPYTADSLLAILHDVLRT